MKIDNQQLDRLTFSEPRRVGQSDKAGFESLLGAAANAAPPARDVAPVDQRSNDQPRDAIDADQQPKPDTSQRQTDQAEVAPTDEPTTDVPAVEPTSDTAPVPPVEDTGDAGRVVEAPQMIAAPPVMPPLQPAGPTNVQPTPHATDQQPAPPQPQPQIAQPPLATMQQTVGVARPAPQEASQAQAQTQPAPMAQPTPSPVTTQPSVPAPATPTPTPAVVEDQAAYTAPPRVVESTERPTPSPTPTTPANTAAPAATSAPASGQQADTASDQQTNDGQPRQQAPPRTAAPPVMVRESTSTTAKPESASPQPATGVATPPASQATAPTDVVVEPQPTPTYQPTQQIDISTSVTPASFTDANADQLVQPLPAPNANGAPAMTPTITPTTADAGPLLDDQSSQQITDRVLRGLQGALNQRGGTVTLRLSPAELGPLRIRVELDGGVVKATFQTAHQQVGSLLNQQMNTLRQALESRGLTVEALQVQQAGPAPIQFGSAQQDTDPSTADGRSRGAMEEQNQQQAQEQTRDQRSQQFQDELVDLVA
jgi:flagellar hook-length control protein FliK